MMDENPYKAPQVEPMPVSLRWKRWLYYVAYAIGICILVAELLFVGLVISARLFPAVH